MDSCVNYGAQRSCVNGAMCPLNKLLSHVLELLAHGGLRASIVFFVITFDWGAGTKEVCETS